MKEKKKWAEVIGSTDSRLNFFSGSKLLLVHKDIVLIQVETKEEQFFLSQTYDLDYQETCQKCWNEKKHLVVITAFQSKIFLFSSFSERENLTEEKALFLFKDEESLKRNLAKILTTKNVIKI